MTKNITVQEHGEPKEFEGVARLDTKLMGGSAMTWLPDDETTAGKLDITENGEYLAANDGLYGYSEITVNVPIEGRDRCVFGYERDAKVAVMACTRDGNLMARMFPSYVKIEPLSESAMRTRDVRSTIDTFNITLMTANDTVYRNLTEVEALGLLNDGGVTPSVWRERETRGFVNEDCDILYAVDGTDNHEGTNAIEERRGRYMSVIDDEGVTIYGRAGYYLVHPTLFAAVPKWLDDFRTFMDSDFDSAEYMVYGREVDGDVIIPAWAKDGFNLMYEFYTDEEDGTEELHWVPFENVDGSIL